VLKPKATGSTTVTSNAIIIPKGSGLKKKSPHGGGGKNGQLTIHGILNIKAHNQGSSNFRTVQGKSTHSSQSTSKSHVIMENRKSQQISTGGLMANPSNLGSGMTTLTAGGGTAVLPQSSLPTNFKTLKLKAEAVEGRNKSPSLSKSLNENGGRPQRMMVIKNEEGRVNMTANGIVTTDSTMIAPNVPRYNNFAHPHSEMSR
jgi:hypothetical protein